jgi:hypothetical protein
MKKLFSVVLMTLGSLMLSSTASASLIGSIFHDYGIGKYDPSGNDLLTNDSVIVSDQSTGRFSDVFDVSSITAPITGLQLVLDFDDAGPSWGELWAARLQGSNSSSSTDDLFVWLSDTSSPQEINLDSTSDTLFADVWSHSIGSGSLGLWFSEFSSGSDSFALNSARLNIFGETASAAVPAPPAIALFAIGALGLGFMSRRRAVTS